MAPHRLRGTARFIHEPFLKSYAEEGGLKKQPAQTLVVENPKHHGAPSAAAEPLSVCTCSTAGAPK
jgi:hypothetical protein